MHCRWLWAHLVWMPGDLADLTSNTREVVYLQHLDNSVAPETKAFSLSSSGLADTWVPIIHTPCQNSPTPPILADLISQLDRKKPGQVQAQASVDQIRTGDPSSIATRLTGQSVDLQLPGMSMFMNDHVTTPKLGSEPAPKQ